MEKHLWLNVDGCTRFKIAYDVDMGTYRIYARIQNPETLEYEDEYVGMVYKDNFYFSEDIEE